MTRWAFDKPSEDSESNMFDVDLSDWLKGKALTRERHYEGEQRANGHDSFLAREESV